MKKLKVEEERGRKDLEEKRMKEKKERKNRRDANVPMQGEKDLSRKEMEQ